VRRWAQAALAACAVAWAGCGYYAPPIHPGARSDDPRVSGDTVDDAPMGKTDPDTEDAGD
jgi:hypothetical protein